MKHYNVKMYIPDNNLLHSEFDVFASDEDAAKEEASKLEEVKSGPRTNAPRFAYAVTEVE